VRIFLPRETAGFPGETFANKSRHTGLCDFITRCFSTAIAGFSRGNRGIGNSGLISIDTPGQEILERTSVLLDRGNLEVRILVGLPAYRRTVSGRQAIEIFFKELPLIIENSLVYSNLDPCKLYRHIETNEDADNLREQLPDLGLVAFIADGSILPRASGIDQKPLTAGRVTPFQTPETYRVQVKLPNCGMITGMGIPRGVTLVVGGGYHGKSTLLRALEKGIYNHVPDDGRELVVTHPDAVKIRAEDGRGIVSVDISPFISNLPFGLGTRNFSTQDASGSTSQAANIMETLELGARLLLIDEDTSATNFMIRDSRMQKLVAKEHEPITPFIDRVKQLHREHGVSTIIVIGGSGDYFDVSDRVICMREYKPMDVADQVKSIVEKHPAVRDRQGDEFFGHITKRIPLATSIDPRKGKRDVKISTKGLHTILFGTHTIDLAAVEQLVDKSQTRAIGDALHVLKKYLVNDRTLSDAIFDLMNDLAMNGLDILNTHPVGHYAYFRRFELAAAINRLRNLQIKQTNLD
jgi:predicted ABC-class ATPase